MADVSNFWRNTDFQDATLLLGSDRLLLEHSRADLQETLDGLSECDTCKHNPKRRNTAVGPDLDPDTSPPLPALDSASSSLQPMAEPITEVSTSKAVAASATVQNQVLTVPVHRIVLTAGSDYFKTAISTLIGDRASAADGSLSRPFHPIIVVHEENVESAQGVLQYLYTKTVGNGHSTATQLMQLLLVS